MLLHRLLYRQLRRQRMLQLRLRRQPMVRPLPPGPLGQRQRLLLRTLLRSAAPLLRLRVAAAEAVQLLFCRHSVLKSLLPLRLFFAGAPLRGHTLVPGLLQLLWLRLLRRALLWLLSLQLRRQRLLRLLSLL